MAALFALTLLMSPPEKAQEEPSPKLVKRGEMLFQIKACVGCHTLTDQKLVGPGLQGLFETLKEHGKDEAWLREYLKDPPAMAQKDPYVQELIKTYKTVMPNLGLKDEEIDALIAFLKVATRPKEEAKSGEGK